MGGRYEVGQLISLGIQECPWGPRTGKLCGSASCDWRIRDTVRDLELSGSELIVHLIGEHGFFEGPGLAVPGRPSRIGSASRSRMTFRALASEAMHFSPRPPVPRTVDAIFDAFPRGLFGLRGARSAARFAGHGSSPDGLTQIDIDFGEVRVQTARDQRLPSSLDSQRVGFPWARRGSTHVSANAENRPLRTQHACGHRLDTVRHVRLRGAGRGGRGGRRRLRDCPMLGGHARGS